MKGKNEETEEIILDLEKLTIETNDRLFESNIEADEKNNKYYYAVNMLIALYKQMQRKSESEKTRSKKIEVENRRINNGNN